MAGEDRQPCPQCGALNYVDDDVCLSCGHDLPPRGAPETAPDAEVAVAGQPPGPPSAEASDAAGPGASSDVASLSRSQRRARVMGLVLGVVELVGALVVFGAMTRLAGAAEGLRDPWGMFPLMGAAGAPAAVGIAALGGGLLAASIGMRSGSVGARRGVAWLAGLNGFVGLAACYALTIAMVARGAATAGLVVGLVGAVVWTLACVVCWGSARWADV